MSSEDHEMIDKCNEGLENLLLKGLKDDLDDDMLSFQSGAVYMGMDNEETPSFLDEQIQRNDRKSLTYKHVGDINKIQALLNKNNVIKPPLNAFLERKLRSDKKWKTMKYNNNFPINYKESLECIEEYDFENNNYHNNQYNNNMYLSTNVTNNSNNNSLMFFHK
jgi:hypothetical protein